MAPLPTSMSNDPRYRPWTLLLIVVVYVAVRLGLLLTSWDANLDWEEPVFLYSASVLRENGVAEIFDHQDDLNHGGSVAVLLAAVAWFGSFPTDLFHLKLLMLLWSGLTLTIFLVVLARYLSIATAQAFGFCFVLLSPTLARINLTAVGSHPESLLFCALALGFALDRQRRTAGGASSKAAELGLGVSGGLAVWCSYASVGYVAPLFLCMAIQRRSVSISLATVVGLVLGVAPWLYQNVWLRPHGALLWRSRVAATPADSASGWDPLATTVADLIASFGLQGPGGLVVVASCAVVLVSLTVVLFFSRSLARLKLTREALLPLLLIPIANLLLLFATDLGTPQRENYYFGRFFIPLQVSMFVVLGLGWHVVKNATPRFVSRLTVAVALAVGVVGQASVFGMGNHYEADSRAEILNGCFVHGLAEFERAGGVHRALDHLRQVEDPGCRGKAVGGFGWQVAVRAKSADGLDSLASALAALDEVDDPALGWSFCGGVSLVSRSFSLQQKARIDRATGARCSAWDPAFASAVAALVRPKNIILIVIDTLRADHLGYSGYSRPTSPFLDLLASRGVVFEQARSNSSYTREAISALMTGRSPSGSGAVGWEAHPPRGIATLAERFGAAGFHTVFLSNTVMLRHPRFTDGFHEMSHLPSRMHLSGQGGRLTAAALGHLRSSGSERNFLYLHYLDPHGPYEPEETFDRTFARERPETPVHLYHEVRPNLPELVKQGFAPGEVRFEDMVARYDAEILETDAAIQNLFLGLMAQGLGRETLVVLTSDHGEEFLEHGFVEHAWTLYEESIRVPLIFWAPGILRAQRIAAPVSLVDLAPTLLGLAGLPVEDQEFDGRGLFATPGVDGQRRLDVPVEESDRPVFSEVLIQERNVLRSVVSEGFKYVVALRWLEPDQRPAAAAAAEELRAASADQAGRSWLKPVREELYDLKADPDEKRNLVEAPTRGSAAQAARLRSLLEEYDLTTGSRASSAPGRVAPEVDPDKRKQLESLGYL